MQIHIRLTLFSFKDPIHMSCVSSSAKLIWTFEQNEQHDAKDPAGFSRANYSNDLTPEHAGGLVKDLQMFQTVFKFHSNHDSQSIFNSCLRFTFKFVSSTEKI